jgi:flagellar M-ring protein FliF
VHAIEPVVGAEHVRASVHVDYDLSSSEDTSEIYDPKSTVALAQQHSEELAGGANPAGVPGVTSNVPGSVAASPTVPSALDNQSSKSDSSTFAVSKNIRHVVNPPGRVRRITASVLIDDALDSKQENGKSSSVRRKRTPEEMTAIEKLARAAIGVDDQRGDLLAIENLSFRTAPVEMPSAPGKLDRYRLLIQPWFGALRYVGITLLFLVVYAFVLNPVKKQAIATFKQIPGNLAPKVLAAAAGGGNSIGGGDLSQATEEAKHAGILKKELGEKIKAEPAAASRLVQSWIHEKKTK